MRVNYETKYDAGQKVVYNSIYFGKRELRNGTIESVSVHYGVYENEGLNYRVCYFIRDEEDKEYTTTLYEEDVYPYKSRLSKYTTEELEEELASRKRK